MTGYARVSTGGVWHFWSPFSGKFSTFYLAAACNKQSLLPRHGAKLKQRHELTEEQRQRICKDCAAKEEA